MIPAGIFSALQAVELGVVTFQKAFAFIKAAREEGRDLTDEELEALDIKRDNTHNDFLDALRRKRIREEAAGG